MGSRGRALDYIFTVRLWRTVKYEGVYLHEYDSPKEAIHQLATYFNFYYFRTPAPGFELSNACDTLNLNKSLHLKLTSFQL